MINHMICTTALPQISLFWVSHKINIAAGLIHKITSAKFLNYAQPKTLQSGPTSAIGRASSYYARDPSLNTDETFFVPVAEKCATSIFELLIQLRKTGLVRSGTYTLLN